jgi:hypothetical protein
MWIYVVGFGLLTLGAHGLKISLSPYDPSGLRLFSNIANNAVLILLILGIYVFSWWTPFAGIFGSVIIFPFIEGLKPNDMSSLSMIKALKYHILIIGGATASIIGLSY